MVDISGIDVGAIAAGVGGLLKAFQSDGRVKETKKDLDVWKREVEMKLEAHAQSLRDGNDRFEKTDAKMDQLNQKMDEANGKIDRLLGFIGAALNQKDLLK